MRAKNPWIAVPLNCIPFVPGLGYLYLEQPKAFLAAFIIGILAAVLGWLIFIWFMPFAFLLILQAGNATFPAWVIATNAAVSSIPLLLVIAFTAWDAWEITSG